MSNFFQKLRDIIYERPQMFEEFLSFNLWPPQPAQALELFSYGFIFTFIRIFLTSPICLPGGNPLFSGLTRRWGKCEVRRPRTDK